MNFFHRFDQPNLPKFKIFIIFLINSIWCPPWVPMDSGRSKLHNSGMGSPESRFRRRPDTIENYYFGSLWCSFGCLKCSENVDKMSIFLRLTNDHNITHQSYFVFKSYSSKTSFESSVQTITTLELTEKSFQDFF